VSQALATIFKSRFRKQASDGDLEDQFQLDRGAERKACDAIHHAGRILAFSEDVLEQLRSAVSRDDYSELCGVPESRTVDLREASR